MKKYTYILLSCISLMTISCNNQEGEGGSSKIRGKIFKVIHPDDIYSIVADTVPAAKEDVYIVYGDDDVYGDKMETGDDGTYEFKYLNKGNYTLYAYSSLSNGTKEAVKQTVSVSKGSTKDVKNIYIHSGKSYGTSLIKGIVQVQYCKKGSPITLYQPAYDVRVYIRAKGANYQFDEARTGLDGVFMFQNITPGTYEVFVFTEDPNNEVLSPVIQEVTVDETGKVVSLTNPLKIVITV